MQIETLRDVLHWTREFHAGLVTCMEHCAESTDGQREKLLLIYLSDHEKKLIRVLDEFEKLASLNALNTWCYEYLDRKPITRHQDCKLQLSKLNTVEIMVEVTNLHEQVIELYEYLLSRSMIGSAHEFLEQLRDMEKNESMLMVRDQLRLEDI